MTPEEFQQHWKTMIEPTFRHRQSKAAFCAWWNHLKEMDYTQAWFALCKYTSIREPSPNPLDFLDWMKVQAQMGDAADQREKGRLESMTVMR